MHTVLTKHLLFNQDPLLYSYPLYNVFSMSMNPNSNFLHESLSVLGAVCADKLSCGQVLLSSPDS